MEPLARWRVLIGGGNDLERKGKRGKRWILRASGLLSVGVLRVSALGLLAALRKPFVHLPSLWDEELFLFFKFFFKIYYQF